MCMLASHLPHQALLTETCKEQGKQSGDEVMKWQRSLKALTAEIDPPS